MLTSCLYAQNWSTFLDPSRATTWQGNVGFTVTNYSAACSTQPSLTAGSGNASANTTAIANALASCDASHNVVNLAAGTYYVNTFTFPSSPASAIVLRGAGPDAPGNVCAGGSTCLILKSVVACSSTGIRAAICITPSTLNGAGSAAVAPGSGANQCSWTAGYSQGTTSITLNSCGSSGAGAIGIVAGNIIVLDQANDLTDGGGIFMCDTYTTSQAGGAPACTANDGSPGVNIDGRPITISAKNYTMSQKQYAIVQSVSGSGTGPYTVTISAPGVYFNNIHSGANPGAWFPGTVKLEGIENLELDSTSLDSGIGCDTSFDCAPIVLAGCSQCWVKGISSYNAPRAHILLNNTYQSVVRDSYFYQSHSHATTSYTIEFEQTSADLVENNICQQVTNCIMTGNTSGSVVGYNLSVGSVYTNSNYLQSSFPSHNAGNDMTLWEGNNILTTNTDDTWGSSNTETYFREFHTGWQLQSSGPFYNTIPFIARSFSRVHNVIGSVLGQPSYHTTYESYATSTTTGTNQSLESVSIYSFGWTGIAESSAGTCTSPPGTGNAGCDAVIRPTMMRWGNYDTVNAAVRWNSTEAAPAAVQYVNANFTTTYFNTLAQTLPNSLYLTATTAGSCGTGLGFWKNPTDGHCPKFPPIGPDVSSGNVGTCSGTYAGAQSTTSSQCTGGTKSSAWGGLADAIPAQYCYLVTMGGTPDGTGSMLGFNPSACYANDPLAPNGPTPAPTGAFFTMLHDLPAIFARLR